MTTCSQFGEGSWRAFAGLSWATVCLAVSTAAIGAGEGFRSSPLAVRPSGKIGFTLLNPAETGVAFTNVLTDAKAAENQIRLNGSGVALGDIDGDGQCDIYLCRLEGPNALYRNLGNWKFEDVTAPTGVSCGDQYSTGAAFADVDGDGDLDLLVNGISVGTRLFVNDGKGKFTEATDSGLIRQFGPTTVALADIDGDDDLDLYVANYRTTTIRTTGFAVLNVGGKRMIRPEDRDHLEYTPEGRVLEHGEPDILYRNDGRGRFTPLPWADGTFLDEDGKPLTKPPFDWGLSAMFRDINRDGAPDLYVCNDFQSTDKIWINDGKGRFRALPRLALRKTSTFSMSVDFGDLNRDGLDDVFVADMLSLNHARRLMQFAESAPYRSPVGVFEDRPQVDRNTLQLNRGDGTYAEIAGYAGLEASDWTWSTVLVDVDLDGYEDILCSTGHMFDTQDLDAEARIQAKGPWRRDLIPQKLLMFPKMQQAKVAFRNRGDLTFEQTAKSWGFDQMGVAHGMALADLDNDGDLDVVVNNLNGAAGVYRNETAAPRVMVRLKGTSPNTRGIGARIRVSDGSMDQSQETIGGGRYLSCDEAVRVFAARSPTNELRIEVSWRRGKRSVIERLKPNHAYEIDETGTDGGATERRSVEASATAPSRSTQHARSDDRALFEDASHLLKHVHADESFDDFSRQPLLPWKISQLGPGVGWFDVNSDGWDDLIIASGRGGTMAVYANDGKGRFQRITDASVNSPVTRDQSGILGWAKAPGQNVLLAGSANYEDGLTNGAAVRQFDLLANAVRDAFPGQPSSAGPLAMADVDGDADLDLFVGGRCIPGRWPEPASSFLLRNNGGRFDLDVERSRAFSRVGLVSGAIFTDLNGDGAPDLVLACEWGPLRVFRNELGSFKPWEWPISVPQAPLAPRTSRLVTPERRDGGVTLHDLTGFWSGVSAGDFDGDGRLDLAAANWGLNSPHQSAREAFDAIAATLSQAGTTRAGSNPALLYHADFDGDGTLDLLEARLDSASKRIVPTRSFNAVAQAMPFLRERFPTYAAYNEASLPDLIGDAIKKHAPARATWLASAVLLNRGDHFELVLLPAEAQFAPSFGVTTADLDGDGNEDFFLAQNFFPVQPAASRLDAGRGMVLLGNGRGGFTALSGQTSGVFVYGEGRGAAVADFDADGRVDLAVGQNGAATKLFHNLAAKPGLRVRLKGPPGNLRGIGAAIRLIYPDGRNGAVREIHAGSGYWSQDSDVTVLGKAAEPVKLWVRWPGGKTTVMDVTAGAREIEVNPEATARGKD
ncbi:MAG: VCBS repeat-containing protein [Verrucomicrobia bacterium]|nr:VCBS repeat-containing protein [Verrucomicrobiota bacterium]